MTQIHNSNLTKELVAAAGLQQRDNIPNQIAEKVVPVINVNPWNNIKIKNFASLGSLSNAQTFTWYTASSTKDTYITNYTLSFIKDATSTATDLRLNIVDENGATQIIGRFAGITLTADKQTISQTFAFPLKILRGSNITLTSDTNVANIIMRATMQGFEIDNPNI